MYIMLNVWLIWKLLPEIVLTLYKIGKIYIIHELQVNQILIYLKAYSS